MTHGWNNTTRHSDGSHGRPRDAARLDMHPKATLADIAGLDEAKAEIHGLIAFLKDPVGHGRLGARIPGGVLLAGPPGSGKTLLARAIAGEAAVPLYVVTGAECAAMADARGAGLQSLFDQACAHAPAVIFIDDLDGLGRMGDPGRLGDDARREQALYQLLTVLDEFDPRPGLLLLAATSRPELLDPTLLRSGRLDRTILTKWPEKAARSAILSLHLSRIKAAPDIDVDRVAGQTPGLSGADLASLVNEAALLATRRGASQVASADLREAIGRMQGGFGWKPRVLSSAERETLAYHAMGRALVAMSLLNPDLVQGISLISGDYYTSAGALPNQTEPRCRDELQAQLAVLLAGRAAERLVFSRVSNADAGALQRATTLARAMVTRYGMAEEFAPIAFDCDPEVSGAAHAPSFPWHFSEATMQTIDHLVQQRIKQALDQACYILKKRRAVLDAGARLLLEKETLTAETLRMLVEEEMVAAA